MKKIGEVITQGQKTQWQGSQDSGKPTDQETVEMELLFGVLAVNYAFFMPKADADLVRKLNMWIRYLKPYDRDQRMAAVDVCLRHYTNKGGPNVTEFVKLLKVDPAHKDPVKLLPAPDANKDKQASEMNKIREILKGESDDG